MPKPRSELSALAERNGWGVPTKLTMRDVDNASPDLLNFWEVFAPAALDDALNTPAEEAKERGKAEEKNAKRIWAGGLTEEEWNEDLKNVAEFVRLYPQFAGTHVPSREALIDDLKTRNQRTTVTNLAAAFNRLAPSGKIAFNPSAVGLGTRELILPGAGAVHFVNQNPQVLEPMPRMSEEEQTAAAEKKRIDTMSADQFNQEFPLPETRMNPYALKTAKTAYDTLKQNHPELVLDEHNSDILVDHVTSQGLTLNYTNLELAFQARVEDLHLYSDFASQYGRTKMLQYAPRASGSPVEEIEKTKIRNDIRRLSSAQLANYFRENPSARRLIDG